jgi:hypothetical protein
MFKHPLPINHSHPEAPACLGAGEDLTFRWMRVAEKERKRGHAVGIDIFKHLFPVKAPKKGRPNVS